MLGAAKRLPRRALLATEVLATWARVRLLVRRRDLPTVLGRLRSGGRAQAADPARLAGAVRRTLAPLPADTRCLTQSLVLVRMLARRGVDSSLVIGVNEPELFGAHAWVEIEGRPLLPDGGYPRLVEL